MDARSKASAKNYVETFRALEAIFVERSKLRILESEITRTEDLKKGLINPENLIADSLHELLVQIEAIRKVDKTVETNNVLCDIMEEAQKILGGDVDLDALVKYSNTLPSSFGANKINHARNIGFALITLGLVVTLASLIFAFPVAAPLLALTFSPLVLPFFVMSFGFVASMIGKFICENFNSVEDGKVVGPNETIRNSLFCLFQSKRGIDKNKPAIEKKSLKKMYMKHGAQIARQ